MHLIESYEDEQTTTIAGRTYPAQCLIEDDDGIRIALFTDLMAVPVRDWTRAHSAGARMVVASSGGSGWHAVTIETFMSERDEHPMSRTFRMDPGKASYFTDFPSYRDVAAAAHEAREERMALKGFVHLHTHSEASPLDGLSTIKEMVREALRHDQPGLGVTDHGTSAAHPDLQREAAKAGIKPVFGIEANFVDDRFLRGDPTVPGDGNRVLYDYRHLILWAETQQGLRNVWAMSTEANRDGFYGRPKMDWDTIARHSEGVLASTACLRGPVAQRILLDDEDGARAVLARLLGIFGDRLWVELHTNQLPEQRKVNEALVSMAAEYGLPTVAVVDSHYPTIEDKAAHAVWIASQTNKDLTDDADLFAGNTDYHLMSETEVREALSYLGPHVVDEAVENTLAITERCNATVSGKTTTPVFSKASTHEAAVDRDADRLIQMALANWHRTIGKTHPQEVYEARFEQEMRLLISKQFCGYYLMVADYCSWSRSHGVMVGPGRGSGSGSLVAYLVGIVGIDPVEADLMFERFLTEGRTSLPDFDVDFPASKRGDLTDYIIEKYGEENVVRVGTHIRLKNKGVVRDLARVLKNTIDIHYPDIDAISKIIDEAEADKAGLGMSWEALWDERGDDLHPFREKYPLLFTYADSLVGRLKSYGKHPAGVVIAPDASLVDSFPMRLAGDDLVIEFDMNAAEALGLVKFDLLTLRTLDTIQVAVDLIREQRGDEVNVYEWTEEYRDPQVWDEISDGHTLGIFQIETPGGTRDTKMFRPQNLNELADVITLVRPGPKNSGLTAMYYRRKIGTEEVTYLDPRLEPILSNTYGAMIYQEQVINTCRVLGGYSSEEADEVRRLLGKKKIEAVAEAGRKFISRCTENGTDPQVAQIIWEQMAEFAKYCVSGDTRVHLASSGKSSDGTVTAEELYRRINAPLLPPVKGRTKAGDEYSGPCVVCGATESPVWTRGACRSCYVWRQKFQDVHRGLYGLVVEADGRIRPGRILMVHKHDPAEVFTVTLEDGREITATANHRHLTPDGLRRVDELVVGDVLIADGGYEEHGYVSEEQRTTVGDRLLAGAVNGRFGEENHGYIDGGFTSLMAWTAQAPEECEECGHDGSEHRLERAHLDGNHANNDWSNLRMLCVSCHKKHDYAYNGRRRRWGKGRLTEEVKIVSVASRGVEPVYSVVFDDPHIWIANGIATQNSFNRSHAYGYAMLGYWTAWLKFHYPIQFLCAVLSTVDKSRIPEFINEARRMGYRVLPPDVNLSGKGFSAGQMEVRYGFDGVKGVGDAAVEAIVQGQPYADWDDFMARKGSGANVGVLKTLAKVGAFDSLVSNRRMLEQRLEWGSDGSADRCAFKDESVLKPHGLPCTFDWDSEPAPKGKRGQDLKRKPLPKRCSKACRNWTAPVLDLTNVEPYTEDEIMEKEMELLGVHLSSTPFDRIPAEILDDFATGEEVSEGAPGDYMVAAIVTKVRTHVDRNGKTMAFLGLYARDADLDVTVFKGEWEKFSRDLKKGSLCFVALRKNDRGLTLSHYQPL